MEVLRATAASAGVVLGKAYIYKKPEITVKDYLISPDTIETEIEKFNEAVETSRKQITGIADQTLKNMGMDKAKIFYAHLEILDDPVMEESVLDKIKLEYKNALFSLFETKKDMCAMLSALPDEYFRERVVDVEDVFNRIMCNIQGVSPETLADLPEQSIVVANDLTPSATAAIDSAKVLAFVTETGGRTSHSAIMARSMEIPAVVGLTGACNKIANGDFIIVDGSDGVVVCNPNEETIDVYQKIKNKFLADKLALLRILHEEAVTADGRKIELCANIGNPKDTKGVIDNNGEGIGLFRTEFLYMDSVRFPSEEEQFVAYKKVAHVMAGRPVIIRTLDIGGDKDLPYFNFPKETNPFLGYRAIRICLDRPDIFKVQLRAILRASAFGKLRIMLPMVISLEELRAAKEILKECEFELKSENIAFDENIETGIMVETPAAVIMAEAFAKEVDFFSIGTNDLTQYTLAVDRGSESIGRLFNSYNPAVLKSIKMVIEAAHKEGKFVGMCGEFAGDEKAVPLLLGLGLDEFSVSASSLLKVKKTIRNWNYSDAQALAEAVLRLVTPAEVENFLNSRMMR